MSPAKSPTLTVRYAEGDTDILQAVNTLREWRDCTYFGRTIPSIFRDMLRTWLENPQQANLGAVIQKSQLIAARKANSYTFAYNPRVYDFADAIEKLTSDSNSIYSTWGKNRILLF